MVVKKQNHSLPMDNEEKRKPERRREIRKCIVQKDIISDETLQGIIRDCAQQGWDEELKLAVNVPRSSVECFHIFIMLLERCETLLSNLAFFC